MLKEFSDPVTGALAFQNPWQHGHENLTDQMAIMRESSELGEHLKRVAKGATFSAVKQQRDATAQREKIRAIEYGAEEHKKNPYRNSANLTGWSEFRARVGKVVADFYVREATEGVTLPWLPGEDGKPTNLTLVMKMQRENPALRSLVDKSLATAKEWAQVDITEAEREAAAAMSRAATAKTLLAAK